MSYFEKIDNSKYMLAAAAIIASLSKETLLSELGNCFPDLFKNDILQIIITILLLKEVIVITFSKID